MGYDWRNGKPGDVTCHVRPEEMAARVREMEGSFLRGVTHPTVSAAGRTEGLHAAER
jgi:hypothetical protein